MVATTRRPVAGADAPPAANGKTSSNERGYRLGSPGLDAGAAQDVVHRLFALRAAQTGVGGRRLGAPSSASVVFGAPHELGQLRNVVGHALADLAAAVAPSTSTKKGEPGIS